MSTIKKKIGHYSAYMLLSEINNIWTSYITDNLSEKTKKSYYNLITELERDAEIPRIDCITDIEIYIVGENAD